MDLPINIAQQQLLLGYLQYNLNLLNDAPLLQTSVAGELHSRYEECNVDEIDCNEDNDDDDEDKRTLFCGNLDERVTEEILYEVFLQAGPIESVSIAKDRDGKPRSFGFITYVHRCSATYAMQLLQGLTLYRKTVTINPREGSKSTPQKRFVPIVDVDEYKKRRSNEQNQSCSNRSTPFKESFTTNEARNHTLDWSLGSSRYRNRNPNQGEYRNSSLTRHSKSFDKPNSVVAVDRHRDRRRDRSCNYGDSDKHNNKHYHRDRPYSSQRNRRRL